MRPLRFSRFSKACMSSRPRCGLTMQTVAGLMCMSGFRMTVLWAGGVEGREG